MPTNIKFDKRPSKDDKITPGFKLQQTIHWQKDKLSWFAWSADGKILALVSTDNTIWLCDLENQEFLNPLETESYQACFSPIGRILASTNKNAIQLWDIKRGKISKTLEGHNYPVISIAWSPDGRTLASASHDKTIKLWNIKTGRLLQTYKGHSQAVISVAFSPDGQTLVSASRDNTVLLRGNGKLQILKSKRGWPLSVAWSPDGGILAFSDGETIQLWDSKTGRQTGILEGHITVVTSISFSSDGRFFASISSDGIRLWRCDTWELIGILSERGNSDSDLKTREYFDKEGLLSYYNKNKMIFLHGRIAFHPHEPILATLDEKNSMLRQIVSKPSSIFPRIIISPKNQFVNS